MTLDRRTLLRNSAALSLATTFGPGFWRAAIAAPAAPGPGPYGSLVPSAVDGLLVPEGFTARVVAVAGVPVGAVHQSPQEFVWPPFPDGAATFPLPDGGWILACNSEVPRTSALRVFLGVPVDFQTGGCSSLVFAADGTVTDAYSILTGTDGNCAGGVTPWGTWISCEEPNAEPQSPTVPYARGACWECDPYQPGEGVALPAMGIFKHEGVAIDPVNGHAFLTEDENDGLFYRYLPDAYPDLAAGTLQAAVMAEDGSVTWADVPDPSASATRTAHQVEGATVFDGGEGIWYDEGYVYFTTKNDHRVWVHDIAAQRITVLYDAADHEQTPLGPAEPGGTSVDNITVSSSGDLFVAEDGGNMEVVIITADTREVAPVIRLEGSEHGGSEVTGPCFSPDGSRMYFSSQRASPAPEGVGGDPTDGELLIFGNGLGVTYEVTGPWRTERVGIAAEATVVDAPEPQPSEQPTTDPAPALPTTGGGAASLGAAAIAAAALLRSRRPERDG